jgi:hypothetical protein
MRIKWLLAPALLAVFGLPAWAQARYTLRADVPFAFMVRKVQMQPGQYTVRRYTTDGADILSIQNDANGHSVLIAGDPAGRTQQLWESSLVFHRTGDEYALQDVWWAGSASGIQVQAPPVERASVASNVHPSSVTVIASR